MMLIKLLVVVYSFLMTVECVCDLLIERRGHRVEVRSFQAVDELLRRGWNGARSVQHYSNSENILLHPAVHQTQHVQLHQEGQA